MNEAYLYQRSSARGVQLDTLRENLVNNHRALVSRGIAEEAPNSPFINKMANWSSWKVLFPKAMEVAVCLAAHTSGSNPHNIVPQKQVTEFEGSVFSAQIYKAPESNEQIFERHHQVYRKIAEKEEKNWTETAQFNKNHNERNLNLFKSMQNH